MFCMAMAAAFVCGWIFAATDVAGMVVVLATTVASSRCVKRGDGRRLWRNGGWSEQARAEHIGQPSNSEWRTIVIDVVINPRLVC